jgi:hypothetical protein
MHAAFAGARPEWSTAGRAWIDLSRGLERETVDEAGRRYGQVSDETTNRAFWRHYRSLMA